MEIQRKGQLYVLIIGGNVSYLRREDLIELHRIVSNVLPVDDGGGGDTRREKLMPRLDRMEVGEQITWPIGSVSEPCVRATASMVKRKSGKCFSCRRDADRGTFTIMRFV